jgi:hypothetical protein
VNFREEVTQSAPEHNEGTLTSLSMMVSSVLLKTPVKMTEVAGLPNVNIVITTPIGTTRSL